MSRVDTIEKTITTAGVAEQASADDLFVSWFIVEFKSANAGSEIYRACNENVDSTYPVINADKPFSWAIAHQNFNLKDLWLDTDTSGDGVWITYGVAQEDVLKDTKV